MATDTSKTPGAFDPVDSKVDFIALEKRVIEWWNANGIPDKYLHRNDSADKRHSFIDGPITANNPMGVHHAWGRAYKDLFLRFRNMQGYRQRFQNGFDGQGLWVEVEVEKELGFNSKLDIEAYGIEKFVQDCKDRVAHFAEMISEQSKRLGFWMDWDDSYYTLSDENNYTIWHFLKVCNERGWIYEGTDVMPWCIRCGTGLSQHEIATEGYQDVVHDGVFVEFPLVGRENESLLTWTTTPWTLTSNVAAAVHPDYDYVKVRQGKKFLYLIKDRVGVLKGDHEVVEELKGSAMVGWKYRGPFDELPAQKGVEHPIIAWKEVGKDEGTGIVHSAPGAGPDDYKLGKELGLPTIAPLDQFGDYVDGFGFLTGMNVMDSRQPIYDSLEEKGILYKIEDYAHRYPFCWRCGTELVWRLVDEWFISMDELRHQMMDITRKIRWVPGFGLEREIDWLHNMQDWMISKKRYWGLALPIYKCHDCGHFDVIGSETELEERAIEGWDEFLDENKQLKSPHRPQVDAVKIACSECGKPVSRIPDVGNVWLDAGIVPFSTIGYRNDKEYWKDWYPADWISESFPGQFRNWFYSMLAMSTTLENREPFKACFSYALMRDENGEEMHKSKGNSILFEDAADKMGVDVMRWLFARHNPAANMNFGYGFGDEVRRQFFIPLWNVYSFFVTYANLDGWTPDQIDDDLELSELDRWLISELNKLTRTVTDRLDNWRPNDAAREIEEFVDGLSNWYVRRSRRRFWKSEDDVDKRAAYQTLYRALTGLTRLLAPITPFLAEEFYRNLEAGRVDGAIESVHLSDWPEVDEGAIDEDLSAATALVRRLASLGRSARAKAQLKVRQPLAELVVDVRTAEERGYLAVITPQLLDELNVKSVKDAGDIGGLVAFAIKPNLRLLGPKYGKDLGVIRSALQELDAAVVAASVNAGESVEVAGFTLDAEEILVEQTAPDEYAVASEGGYSVGVSVEVTPELKAEGTAREVIHLIQNLRRDSGFEISDRIETYLTVPGDVQEALLSNEDYLKEETLSLNVFYDVAFRDASPVEHVIDGERISIGVMKAG
ncbi:MAG: isoleucine--tRNA ligase [Chloroflexi bacterium]|nr:isoleucine--tRNA ligase [Chloroflexota bacterium]